MSTPLEAIRSLRRAGLSQAEISRRTGIPQPRVSRWEAGNIPTAANDAVRLISLAAEIGEPEPSSPSTVPIWPEVDRRHPEHDSDWVAKPRRRATDDPALVARQNAPLGQAPQASGDQPSEAGNAAA